MNRSEILATFYKIADAQDWHSHHTPKNLATAVAIEAAELLAEFQWLTDEESIALAKDAQALTRVSNEIADVTLYLTVLADKLGIDLDEAIANKSRDNAARFLPSKK